AQRNMGVLDMLNTKYFLFSDDQGATQVQLNEAANGNAWFVENLKLVASANEEMQALDSLDSKNTAVLNRKDYETQFIANETLLFEKDSTATIQLKNYDVTTLTYRSNTQKEQFAVFSEIYYKEGWNAYIDGDLTPHFRVNYVLRGMKIPAGDHQVVFQFEPNVIKEGKIISLIAYGLLLLFPIGWFFYEKKYLK
ncbi:YfhO family protein, partial [Polaribacter sp.]|nr:YfhO family protein [Polaribacter sp.]